MLLFCTQNNKCCLCIFFSDKNQETIENKPTTTELAVPEKDEKSMDIFIFIFRPIIIPFFADPCVYFNLEFKGGDLSVIPSLGFAACKLECQKLKDCAFFTINKVACVLKDANVEIQRKTGVISGATDSTCGKCHKKQTKQMVCY